MSAFVPHRAIYEPTVPTRFALTTTTATLVGSVACVSGSSGDLALSRAGELLLVAGSTRSMTGVGTEIGSYDGALPAPRRLSARPCRLTVSTALALNLRAHVARKTPEISAKAGWNLIKERYDAAGPRKTEVGFVDFGCNAAIKTGGKFETWMGAGMVTVGIGGNAWAGGANKEPFALAHQLPGATVTLDGKVIVENGVLK